MPFAPVGDVIADVASDEVSASQGLPARSSRDGAPSAGATPSSGPARQLPAIVRVEMGKPPRNARRVDIYRPRIVGAAQRREASSGAGEVQRAPPYGTTEASPKRTGAFEGTRGETSLTRVRRFSPRLERVLDIDVFEYPRRYVVL